MSHRDSMLAKFDLVRFVHPLKALSSTLLMEFGRFISERMSHSANAPSRIVVTEFGIMMEVSSPFALNEKWPISTTIYEFVPSEASAGMVKDPQTELPDLLVLPALVLQVLVSSSMTV